MRKPICFLLMAAGMLPTAMPSMGQSADNRPFLSNLFGDDMVLQRDRRDPIWGWTTPGAQVTVKLGNDTSTVTAGADGKWMAALPKRSAGGPYTIDISGPRSIELKNVLFGDVWICSGQSNMQFGVQNLANAKDEIAAADHPQVRLFMADDVTAATPRDTVPGSWSVCTPDNIVKGGWGGFSAVAYFFGRDLQQDLNVPIGLLETTWGGTPAEAWTSESALKTLPEFANVDSSIALAGESEDDLAKYADNWIVAHDAMSRQTPNPSDPSYDDSSWKTMDLPIPWQQAGMPDYHGVVWFRRSFDLTDSQLGKDVPLHLCQIDDTDCTWVNGVRVGGGVHASDNRNYVIPASALHAGKNVITIRVLDTGGLGGIYGNADLMRLDLPDGSSIPLKGAWLYLPTTNLNDMGPVPSLWPAAPQNTPTMLYNAMIAPLIPLGIKGAIWYQGEANAGSIDQAIEYRRLLPTMIDDWRTRWGEGDFPFLIVQLANFMAVQPQPVDEPWAYLRESQADTADTVKNAGLALAIDIGDANDIHPKNKQEVGRRLELIALAKTYKRKVEYSGPVFDGVSSQPDGSMTIRFKHAEGLNAHGDKLTGFAVAGPDHKFAWADAKIVGNTVVVSSPDVPAPVAVRYAWANNPVCDLYNGAGLPAVPFRTDSW